MHLIKFNINHEKILMNFLPKSLLTGKEAEQSVSFASIIFLNLKHGTLNILEAGYHFWTP